MSADASEDHLSPDGRPVPPATLRRLSVDSDDATVFFEQGRRLHRAMEALLSSSGGAFVTALRIVDLDCGAGFIARWPSFAPGTAFLGFDENVGAIDWCRGELYGRFEVLRPGEMLPAEDAFADLIYSAGPLTVSVSEVERILAPGGRLLLAEAAPETRLALVGSVEDAGRTLRLFRKG